MNWTRTTLITQEFSDKFLMFLLEKLRLINFKVNNMDNLFI